MKGDGKGPQKLKRPPSERLAYSRKITIPHISDCVNPHLTLFCFFVIIGYISDLEVLYMLNWLKKSPMVPYVGMWLAIAFTIWCWTQLWH